VRHASWTAPITSIAHIENKSKAICATIPAIQCGAGHIPARPSCCWDLLSGTRATVASTHPKPFHADLLLTACSSYALACGNTDQLFRSSMPNETRECGPEKSFTWPCPAEG
jgi:hypothetical protein